MKMLPPPDRAQALRNQALALRQLATCSNALAAIGRETSFRIGTRWFHNDDHATAAPDRCVPNPVTGQVLIAAHPLTPMELIDDACAFEADATRIDRK